MRGDLFAVIGPETRPEWVESPTDSGRRRLWLEVRTSGQGATCRGAFSGDVLARVRGSGWATDGEVLARALSRLFNLPPFDGSRGVSSVRHWASRHGVQVLDMQDALYFCPDPFEGVQAGSDTEGAS